MSSSDSSVKLTAHRIIYESAQGRQQIMPEDFESYQFKHSSIGAYGILLFIFIVITFLIAVNKITNYLDNRNLFREFNTNLFDIFWDDKGFIILLVLLMIFHFFYLISRRYIIKLNGKFNSIEFRVKSFKHPSIRKMLDKMVEQSNTIKVVKQTHHCYEIYFVVRRGRPVYSFFYSGC